MADEIFGLYQGAKWVVGGKVIKFPTTEIKEVYRNRLIQHKRAYRKGARLDDTHEDPIGWQITIEAYNSPDHEPGIIGLRFYPTQLNKLLDSFQIHETGDLTLPTRGVRRCRAESYERVERAGERDAAAVVLTWLQDNEDDQRASDFQAPNAASIAKKVAQDATRASEEQGAGGDLSSSINELGASIEGTLNAPGDFVGDIESQANAIASAVDKIESTFARTTAEAANEVETLLSDPGSSRAGLLHRKLADAAKQAATLKQTNIGQEIITKTFRRDLSLFAIAASTGNTAPDVLSLNPTLNPFSVLTGTVVRVYAV